MSANEPELLSGVTLVPEAATPVAVARLNGSDEARASESVTCRPNTVIDPSGFETVIKLLVAITGAAWLK